MPGATLTTVNDILKEIYQGQIRDQLATEIIGLKRIEQSSRGVESTVGGKYVTFPIRVSRNQGIGYRSEDEDLPAAGQQGYKSVRVGLKYGYGRTRITGQTMRLAKTNTQAFANAMDKEMNGLKEDIRKDAARIFYGDGKGQVAIANASGSTTTLVCGAGKTQFAQIGMVCDLYTVGMASRDTANVTITAINNTTGTITYTPAGTTTVSGWSLVRAGSANATGSPTKEPMGLAGIVTDTGILQNLDAANEPTWKAVVNHNSGTPRALSEALMIKMVDDIRVNGGKVSLILTTLGVRRAYFALLTQQRRYVEMRNFEGGYVGLAFNAGREIPVVEDVDCPPGLMYFLDESTFTVYRDEDWHWIDDDGNVLKWVANRDAFEAVLAKYWELGVDRRNSNGVLKDITEG